MLEIVKLIIGIGVLLLGIPIGNILARNTREELRSGQKYYRLVVGVGLIGGLVGLIIRNDVLLFTMFFIAIVSSGSVKNNYKKSVRSQNKKRK